jgi:hypothetical protein
VKHHAEIIAITGRSYRLRNQKAPAEPGEVTVSNVIAEDSKPAIAPTGSGTKKKPKTAAVDAAEACQS